VAYYTTPSLFWQYPPAFGIIKFRIELFCPAEIP